MPFSMLPPHHVLKNMCHPGRCLLSRWFSCFCHQHCVHLPIVFLWTQWDRSFFCEMPAIVSKACTGKHQEETVVSVSAVFNLTCPLSIILVSYACILSTVVRTPSTTGRRKTFSTCSSHLTVVSLFFGTAISMYLRPRTPSSIGQLKVSSVLYITVTPALNPVIYSLRNKEVIQALRKAVAKM